MKLIEAHETIFFKYLDGCLRQGVDLVVENPSSSEIPAALQIVAGGEAASAELILRPGQHTYRAYAPYPPSGGMREGFITLRAAGASLEAGLPLGHHRPWSVYLLSDVCTDYTWVYDSVSAMKADDAALLKAELDGGTRYNLVHSRQVEFFLEAYPHLTGALIEAIRAGQITLNPARNMTLFGDMTLEAILRTFYPARRLARRYGLSDQYANVQETPTAPWILPTLFAGMGVTGLVRSSLPYECPWAKRIIEPPVYQWEGPDGSRIQVRFRNGDYVEGAFVTNGLQAANDALHNRILPEYESRSDYTWNVLALVGCYGDLAPSSRELPAKKAAAIAAYNAQGWDYPRLVDAAHADFWTAIGKASLPAARGDYGASWEAWPACLAYDFAAWRSAQRRAAAADGLSAILRCLAPEWWSAYQERVETAWSNIIALADHAWNGANDANRALNARLRRQWQQAAHAALEDVLVRGLKALGSRVPTGEQQALLVFNPLGWDRGGVIRLPEGAAAPAGSQTSLENDRLVTYTLAEAVPSVGYRCFTAPSAASPRPAPHPGPTGLKSMTDDKGLVFESPFYALAIHPVSGAIASLYDKIRQQELVDPASSYGVNEPIYLTSGEAAAQPGAYQLFIGPDLAGAHEARAQRISAEITAGGPIFAELTVASRIAAPNGRTQVKIVATYRLYHTLDRLDIRNEVEKPVSVEKQQLDFVFPFRVPDRQYRFETPGVIVDPASDYRPGAGQSVAAVQSFVDVFNAEFGVTLATVDSGLIQFGHRTTAEDPFKPDPTNSTIRCLALGNCYDWNEAIRDQGGATHFTFRYSLRGHGGGFDPLAALRFGWEAACDLLAMPLPAGQHGFLPADAHSFVTLSPNNAILTGFKPADDGDGIIVRLWEAAGQPCQPKVQVQGLGQLDTIRLTDYLETDLNVPPVSSPCPLDPIPPRGIKAVRLSEGAPTVRK